MEGWYVIGFIAAVMVLYRVIVLPKKIELNNAKEKYQNSLNKKQHLENEALFRNTLLINVNADLQKNKKLKGNNKGRAWFASMYAEVQSLLDDHRAEYLRWKKHPSRKGAEIVKEVNKDKRELN